MFEILKDRAYKISGNHKYYECQRALTKMVYKLFDKKQDQEGQWQAKWEECK